MAHVAIQTRLGTLIPFSSKKPIYYVESDKNIIVKMYKPHEFTKMEREFNLQKRAYDKSIRCPKIIECFVENEMGYFAMERIHGKTLYELYGEESSNIPAALWKSIHNAVYKLFHLNIHYVDITPYNFMIDNATGKLVVIDFGDAYECKVNWFLKEFLDGEKSWNPDYE